MSVLVSVPKILDVLREHVLRVAPESAEPPPGDEHFTRRWWRYRRAHRLFGLKFWSFVVGAAPLDPALEEFWGRLGFVVIQGYGLTETAPIVSLNHPFSASNGSVGKAIAGVEVKIATGRRDSRARARTSRRATSAQPRPPRRRSRTAGSTPATSARSTRNGRLFIKGRKKEMIVTPGRAERLSGRRRTRRGGTARREGRRRGRACAAGSEERVHAVVVTRSRDRPAGTRPVGQPDAARPPEDSRHLGLAVGRSAADRGHAEAEAPQHPRLGGHGRYAKSRGRARCVGRGPAGAFRRRTIRFRQRRRSTSWVSARSSASS